LADPAIGNADDAAVAAHRHADRVVAVAHTFALEGPHRGRGCLAAGIAAHRPGVLPACGHGAARAGGAAYAGIGPGGAAVYVRGAGGGVGDLFAAFRGAAAAERL